MIYLWVAIGGALGSVARYGLVNAVAAALGTEFPWGTLFINIFGSFLIGLFSMLAGRAGRFAISPDASVFLMAGVCGGFTTFSAFSLQTVQLVRAGEWERVGAYVAASVLICVLFCWLGIIAGLAADGSGTEPLAADIPQLAAMEITPTAQADAGADKSV